jgi:Cu-processing system permease protein
MNVWIIARYTFLEAVRARVFLYLLVVGAAMIAGSVPTSELGLGDEMRLVVDVSVAGCSYVCVFLSVFLGVSAVSGEVEKRTVYTIIAKAASRRQFVIGKFLGVWLTVMVAATASYAMVIALVSALDGRFASEIVSAYIMTLMEMGLLIALAVFFSCITRPLLSSGLTAGLYLTGVSLRSLYFWIEKSKGAAGGVASILYRMLPNYQIFDVRTEMVHRLPIAPSTFLYAFLYMLAYGGALLTLACFIFDRRDLK